MFRKLNAKHGSERPENLQDLRIKLYFFQKGAYKSVDEKAMG